jgi:dephospho-CoA kinase
MPVVVITGLRQSGKSTFLQHVKDLGRRRYVSLDDFAELAAARSQGPVRDRRDRPAIAEPVRDASNLDGAARPHVWSCSWSRRARRTHRR